MPTLGHYRKKRIFLPSFDDPKDKAWVELALDFPASWISETETEDGGWDMISKVIVAWNLVGDDGKVAAITPKSVKRLNHTDQRAIVEALGLEGIAQAAKLTKNEKKT